MKANEKKVSFNQVIFVIIMFIGLLILSDESQAHLIGTGGNTAEWHTNSVNISFSGVDDESCRLFIPAECSLLDVGKNSYNETGLFTVAELTALIAEPDFYTVFNITAKNSESWALCEVACSIFAPTRPTFNLLTGSTNNAIGSASFLTSIRNEGAISAVPVPAAIWLFGSGLIGLVLVSRRQQLIK